MALHPLHGLVEQLETQPIIFIGGKGGVGKTTTAAALASYYASQQQKTLIVSTDPAHSLGDVLNVRLNNETTVISPYLDAIELNPDVIVDEHFAQVERTIKAYANPDMMPKIREHLRLSKSAPGAQEAAMLESMCHHLVEAADAGYEHIIFDTAPTGHTLRLLVLPEMMGAWTDGLLAQQRRQAKLRSVATHLDSHNQKNSAQKNDVANPFAAKKSDRWEQAVSVLEKRKQLFRQAGLLLHDRTQTAIVLVMTADVLPLAETKRAIEQLEDSKLMPTAIVINQLISTAQSDEFWRRRAERQQHLLQDIEQSFTKYPLYPIYLQQTDVRGTDALSALLSV
ncbi:MULTISPECIES: ArsA family ATPase [Psychrobacter]|jgi:arsenite-transporting ATPase|uniref:ArsA family ATPase n=1 Tax=Psychrobacter TaxID=497 RepID=UPI00086B340F|nr:MULTISPECIES: ArsA family ATPase [Psychrobacter]MBA6244830.1 ArsA family ATPase [Psychrobacter sp. Urea-trap-18]MBA6285328.1 ArsA family ATPase [Psychrobacter sp. Urea-trap-16]MBA6318104.1 ArsA family ATPase [Psychrobacter sp. Urea-trap-20]MBA6333609.1 ArsA family ATPase [Psychrobacter sp. Urea-trap-19]OEH68759.1 MAG: arsenic-transporting ATPase [Psychrobacter sp. B29-1]|tara:strand:- start:8493 stop:9509 length:1017 start_codon:yes stop_codon:yes gene_type:complete